MGAMRGSPAAERADSRPPGDGWPGRGPATVIIIVVITIIRILYCVYVYRPAVITVRSYRLTILLILYYSCITALSCGGIRQDRVVGAGVITERGRKTGLFILLCTR